MLESFTQNELRVPTRMACLYILLLLTHFVCRRFGCQLHVLEEPQCTCFKLLKICGLAVFGLAAREAYNTHMKWWRNRNLQKNGRFFTTLFANAVVQSGDSSFYLFAAGKSA